MAGRLVKIEQFCNDLGNRPLINAEIGIVEACGVISIPVKQDYTAGAVDDVTDTTHTHDGVIVLKDGYKFETWAGRKKGSGYEAEKVGDEDAETVTAKVNIFIPRIGKVKTWQANQTINTRYIVAFKDNNIDQWRIIGEVNNGCFVKLKEVTTPRNGYELEAMAEDLNDYPAWYVGDLPDNTTP